MDLDPPTTTTTTKSSKYQILTQTTIRSPPFSYAHLSLVSPSPSPSLDALTARQYLTSSLRQFLGDTGASMAIDILLVKGAECWVRVPRDDLAGFAAAVTAYPGHQVGGEQVLMRVVGCGDWLGALVGREEEGELWG
ncbi:hypothetical protein QBC32DRAFT_325448 [Pseudoneurospora amorphoporcata]|uniref:Ribonucleases P/MRP subunit Pop8-like domain-containing protein n=1 Tax=Pseudoneurospora amorphoporcata TaxID=241081 RepID=A0AAN6NUB3_9PEZI|nr:hypothetical protein QBC32DRAFT_325448 [Pseudoneurospora amorphoporcata]